MAPKIALGTGSVERLTKWHSADRIVQTRPPNRDHVGSLGCSITSGRWSMIRTRTHYPTMVNETEKERDRGDEGEQNEDEAKRE